MGDREDCAPAVLLDRQSSPNCCDLQSRKANFPNFTNFGWLVGRCRDRPSRALSLTCTNVKTFFFKKKKEIEPQAKKKKRKM